MYAGDSMRYIMAFTLQVHQARTHTYIHLHTGIMLVNPSHASISLLHRRSVAIVVPFTPPSRKYDGANGNVKCSNKQI